MRDQPKTLSDICARIRTIDESMMRDLDFIAVFLEFLPRDIEAAAERERQDAMKTALLAKCKVCEKVGPASAPGNAAALRAALEKAHNNIKKARAALAAPARNCDRFKTLDEAREAFQDLRGHKILADVELWDSMDEAGALVRWLFAPAEGGKE